jgi:hypothetical protein
MRRDVRVPVILLTISAFIGLIRGYRMILHPEGNSILFPYPNDTLEVSVFNNHTILGMVVFILAGVFSLVVILCTIKRFRAYPYLIIVEGIFVTFFSVTHLLLAGFTPVHLLVLPICFALIMVGISHTPKEF